jgi:hypothetical protein
VSMVTGRDCLVQREYYREQVRMAERARLARSVRARSNLVLRLHSLLNWLGARLVAWGTRLEEQYEAVVSPSPAQPAVGR